MIGAFAFSKASKFDCCRSRCCEADKACGGFLAPHLLGMVGFIIGGGGVKGTPIRWGCVTGAGCRWHRARVWPGGPTDSCWIRVGPLTGHGGSGCGSARSALCHQPISPSTRHHHPSHCCHPSLCAGMFSPNMKDRWQLLLPSFLSQLHNSITIGDTDDLPVIDWYQSFSAAGKNSFKFSHISCCCEGIIEIRNAICFPNDKLGMPRSFE